ncbi:MAG TPA: D-alanine--D-alanine ligase [Tepidisphaeraceae bacterium]|jgi:D-alanine-D-alanine ligase|nr:D-alanine--D-alanine ligase [Tepidisphaeraceae bacterium]
MKVTVLYGGPSAEREISLISGKAVIEGLKSMGHEVFASDVSPTDLAGLDHPADVVFPVLHGQFGESGELQEILESRGLPFVGSGSAASRTGMNKAASKDRWKAAGLPTAAWQVINGGPEAVAELSIEAPCVVKALDSGSSIDVYVCKTSSHAKAALGELLAKHGRAMVEKFVKGTELTVGILEEKPLAPIRITTSHEFFDFTAKYKGNDAQHHFDLGLPGDVIAKVQEIAKRAHETIGCRDLSRVDVIVDEGYQPWILEINTLPGFTPKSLLPEAAAHGGTAFGPLVDRLVKRAKERGSK